MRCQCVGGGAGSLELVGRLVRPGLVRFGPARPGPARAGVRASLCPDRLPGRAVLLRREVFAGAGEGGRR